MTCRARIRVPTLGHLVLALLLLGPPLLVICAPLIGLAPSFDRAVALHLVWAASFVIWIPAFCWVVSRATMRDILLTILFSLISIVLVFALEIVMFSEGGTVELHLRSV